MRKIFFVLLLSATQLASTVHTYHTATNNSRTAKHLGTSSLSVITCSGGRAGGKAEAAEVHHTLAQQYSVYIANSNKTTSSIIKQFS